MRIVVSSDSDRGLDSSVSHHFGRCPYFTVVDVLDGEFSRVEAVENPFFGAHSPGEVPAFVKKLEADVMIAGGMGGRALGLFSQYNIHCATGASGSVRSTLGEYLSGSLDDAAPCRESVEHGHGGRACESDPAERLREEAEYLLNKMDTEIVRLEGPRTPEGQDNR